MRNNILICIATYKRTEYLNILLKSIYESDDIKEIGCDILVVDNDKEETGKKIVEKYKNINYIVEYNPGIVNVRNRCISYAYEYKYDYLAFLDDDEFVQNEWLKNLLITMDEYEADIVVGRAIVLPNNNTPNWIKSCLKRKKNINKTGYRLNTCASNNTLIRMESIKKTNLKFDINYNTTGGEDTKFFMELNKLDKKIIFCGESIVYEHSRKERETFSYYRKKHFMLGANYNRILKEVYNHKSSIRTVIESILKVFFNIFIILIFFWRGDAIIHERILKIYENFGKIADELGKTNYDYW